MLRAWLLTSSVLLAGACVDIERSSIGQRLVGGQVTFGDHAVVLVEPGCTGTLITSSIVLTAAHCNVPEGSDVTFELENDQEMTVSVSKVSAYRLYSEGTADIALLLLSEPIDLEPIKLAGEMPAGGYGGQTLRVVGFGASRAGGSGVGTKREADFPIEYQTDEAIVGGNQSTSLCFGDSGGPALYLEDGEEKVAGVSRNISSFGCNGQSFFTRVDRYIDIFLVPQIDAWESVCKLDGDCVVEGCRTADPDCAPCGLDGICSSGCSVVDLDCPPKSNFGAGCASDEDCESLSCISDDNGRYCSASCDGTSSDCPLGSECVSIGGDALCALKSLPQPEGGCRVVEAKASLLLLFLILLISFSSRRRRIS